MRFSENRTIAWVVLAVCVLTSVFGFGGMGLARERGKVLDVYENGTHKAGESDSARESVDAYLDDAAESARLAASEARISLGENARIDAVFELSEKLATEKSLDARYETYLSIQNKLDDVYDLLMTELHLQSEEELTENAKSKKFMTEYYHFRQSINKVKYDDYAKYAYAYNSLIKGFPGSVVAAITGQGAMNTFGGKT